jgi:multidrug efflux pump subunit AcrB
MMNSNRNSRAALLLLVASVVGAAPVAAQEIPAAGRTITLEEAVRTAVEQNRDLQGARIALQGAEAQVRGTVRSAIQGTEAAKYRAGKDEYDIVVRLAEPYRKDLNALQDLTVMKDGRQIPLPSVATWRTDEGAASVIRKDLNRVVTVSSDVRSGENSNAVLADVKTTLADFADGLPAGYTMKYTGQQEDQQESQQFLFGAFIGAL